MWQRCRVQAGVWDWNPVYLIAMVLNTLCDHCTTCAQHQYHYLLRATCLHFITAENNTLPSDVTKTCPIPTSANFEIWLNDILRKRRHAANKLLHPTAVHSSKRPSSIVQTVHQAGSYWRLPYPSRLLPDLPLDAISLLSSALFGTRGRLYPGAVYPNTGLPAASALHIVFWRFSAGCQVPGDGALCSPSNSQPMSVSIPSATQLSRQSCSSAGGACLRLLRSASIAVPLSKFDWGGGPYIDPSKHDGGKCWSVRHYLQWKDPDPQNTFVITILLDGAIVQIAEHNKLRSEALQHGTSLVVSAGKYYGVQFVAREV